jgi:hypothetical protein
LSHTTTIRNVDIKDVRAIRSAVKDLQTRGVKCELKENAKARMYYPRQTEELGVLPFVLHLPQSQYDVGFQLQADGTYAPVFDEWAGEVSRNLGAACAIPQTDQERSMWAIGQFSQEYAKHAAINAATDQGYIVEGTTVDAKTGEIAIVITNC